MNIETAYIHPTLLLSLTDHFYRIHTCENQDLKSMPIFGLILGKFSANDDNTVSLLNAFELPCAEIHDKDQLRHHISLLSEIYGKNYLQLVGFYNINDNNSDNLFDKIVSNLDLTYTTDSILNNIDINNLISLNINNFENIKHSKDLEDIINLKLINSNKSIPYKIELIKAETLSASTLQNAPTLVTTPNTSINSEISSALDDLNFKLEKSLQFISKVKAGEIDISKNQAANDTFNALTYLAGKMLALKSSLIKEENQNNDQLEKIIALTSLSSSLLRENLESNI